MLMKPQLSHCQLESTKVITACPDYMYLCVQNRLLTNMLFLTINSSIFVLKQC